MHSALHYLAVIPFLSLVGNCFTKHDTHRYAARFDFFKFLQLYDLAVRVGCAASKLELMRLLRVHKFLNFQAFLFLN